MLCKLKKISLLSKDDIFHDLIKAKNASIDTKYLESMIDSYGLKRDKITNIDLMIHTHMKVDKSDTLEIKKNDGYHIPHIDQYTKPLLILLN